MSRPTAWKHVTAAQPQEELQVKHRWRTRQDPLVEIWPQAETLLADAPDLKAKALFEHLWERSPWAGQEKHLRTFQRRVKRWRLAHGADKEVFFPQDWEAGRLIFRFFVRLTQQRQHQLHAQLIAGVIRVHAIGHPQISAGFVVRRQHRIPQVEKLKSWLRGDIILK
jgi:hypothetical protein